MLVADRRVGARGSNQPKADIKNPGSAPDRKVELLNSVTSMQLNGFLFTHEKKSLGFPLTT